MKLSLAKGTSVKHVTPLKQTVATESMITTVGVGRFHSRRSKANGAGGNVFLVFRICNPALERRELLRKY
jgi:hypothetical protein